MQTTYQQLEKIVLPHLKNYITDLTKHDFNTLEKYTGKFIYGYRETGTNILQFVDSVKDYFKESFLNTLRGSKEHAIETIRKELYSQLVWITTNNKTFLYFDGVKFHPKTKEQITLIWREHTDQICRKLYLLNEDSETFVKIF